MGVAAVAEGLMADTLFVSIPSSLRLTVVVADGCNILGLWQGNIFHSHEGNLNQGRPFKR